MNNDANTGELKQKRILWVNGAVSLFLFGLLLFVADDILRLLIDYLMSVFRPLVGLAINVFDLIIFATIPIWTFPLYSRKKDLSVGKIILVNVAAFGILILTSIAVFFLLDYFSPSFATNPLLPDYIVYIPFPFFQTLVFITGILLTYLLFGIFRFRKKNDATDLLDGK